MGTTPAYRVVPPSTAVARSSQPAWSTRGQVEREGPGAGANEQGDGCLAGTAVQHGVQLGGGGERTAEQVDCPLFVDGAVPAPAAGGRDRPGQNGGQSRLVELDDQLGGRHPAPQIGEVVRQPGGERVREIAPRAVVREDLVTARLLERRRQRPRSRQLHLERAFDGPGEFLQDVQVLLQQRPGPALVETRARTRQPPPGRLQVETELGQYAGSPAQHVPVRTGRQFRQERDRHLAEHQLQGLPDVLAGHGPDARELVHAATRSTASMVADPITRVPS